MHKRGLCRRAVSVCLSVCLSVCPSVTFVNCVETGNHIVRLFSPSGRPIILVFVFPTKRDGNIPTTTPITGASNAKGYEKITIFDQYFALSPKWCKVEPYYRRRIENRTQAFEWYQFECPWVTQISRSRYNSTSNNSKMVQDIAIFIMADQ